MSDLVSFERAAYARLPERADLMIKILRLTTLGRLMDDSSRPERPIDSEAMIGRLAAALAAVMADPQLELSSDQADRLMIFSGVLRQILELAGFGGTDFLRRLAGDPTPDMPVGQINRRFAMLSLASSDRWSPDILANAPPRLAWEVMTALIATKPVTTPAAQDMRDRLLEYADEMPPPEFPLNVDYLVHVSNAWMLCSYGSTPAKHALKRRLNESLRAMAAAWGLTEVAPPPTRALKPRPLLLFAAEMMNSQHVQYRYFGQYLRQLRECFELVLLTEKFEADPGASALFDRVMTFERGGNPDYLRQIHAMIVDTAPDIIFYPSVGMRHWGPLFANLRLAPIQMTALGHSASSFCETIDYYLLEQGYVSDPALFGETVVTLPDASLIFERTPGYRPVTPVIRANPRPLRIALPSNLLKLNPRFLSLVAKIRAATSRPLEVHCLPARAGLELESGKRAIGKILPGASVHGLLPYDRYMDILSNCDLVLSPFPFGGLHSVVDSLRQGLPVVAMDCPEPHGRTDAMLLRRLGMPDWLIARTEQEYETAALRIIDDDNLRVTLSEQAVALDIDGLIFGDAATPLRHEVRDAVWWLYRHHEAALADGRKLWDENGRASFPD